MHQRVSIAAILGLLALPTLAHAQDNARSVQTPLHVARETTPNDARRILGALASDSMEGRATGTAGAHRAAKYIAGEMRRMGLTPAGDSGFFQKVPVMITAPPPPSAPPANGRGGRGGGARPRLMPSFADLDSVPAERRRTEVNVLGVIPGTDPAVKDEIILIDAHYDHLGIRTPQTPGADSIYNGADDDASGVTAVLEIARQLKEGPPLRRTIVFAAMIGEEVGLIGTNWYLAHPAFPLENMVANLEIEMIDRPDSLAGGPGKAWLTGFERSNMGEMFQAAGLQIVPDARPSQSFFTRSDNIGFARRGIVAHTLSTFDLHADYHHAEDDVNLADFNHMAGVINTGAKAARLLANGPKPEWKPGGQPTAGRR
ncbi:MAG TPA: M20/M25/M40 family metallo-hydrolase [Gemmatimonadaceae bacterium]|nr:M20/M25/M40 family metallo-hydrolase [Gemmatimonadaceae bacterium]